MKISITSLLLFLCLSANLNAQSEVMVHLENGSQIRGQIQENEEDGIYILTLSDGSELILEATQIKHIDHSPEDYRILHDGRRLLTKGRYTAFGFHTLTARPAAEWQPGYRWAVGGHFSMGHQFNQKLAVGAGAGLDFHEEVFLPVFAEVTGLLDHKIFSLENAGKKGYKVPLTYGLQVGWNFPVEEWLRGDDNDFEQTKGGWLVYPSVGLAFPSRSGHTLKIDFGYKFQRFARKMDTSQWWWGNDYEQSDKVTLKSVALRAGWVF